MVKGKALQREAKGFAIDGGRAVLNRSSYADQAYVYLFHQITSGAFGEGDALPSENELCTLFGISRPVVRKALERLREDDLIESRRGSGSFVKRRRRTLAPSGAFTDGRLRELLMNLEYRKVIEPAAAMMAARRRSETDLAMIKSAVDEFEAFVIREGKIGRHFDFKFHHAVATASGNNRFVEAISAVEYDIDNAVNLARYLVRYEQLERARMVWHEHLGIYHAIEQQDGDAAHRLMSEHLEQARIRMIEHRPEPPSS